jgi:uncharacterized protein YegL
MRRLPIYFFVDIFPSLPIQETKKIENFIIDFIQSCRQNPHALETVYLSINNLCENNISLNKLIGLLDFKSFNLKSQNIRNLNHTFKLLNEEVKHNLANKTTNQKSDYEPIIILFINNNIRYDEICSVGKIKRIFILLNESSIDFNVLKKISDNLLDLNTIDISTFCRTLLRWDWEDADIIGFSEKLN